jgi:hypothetical protein
MSLVPRDVGGHASNVVRMGPLPGVSYLSPKPEPLIGYFLIQSIYS